MPCIPWTITGADDQPILGHTHLPKNPARGVFIIAHGFKGYKDYGFFPALADRAALAGLIAHRFNFSHSGMTDELETFARPDLFERETWGKQTQDLSSVASAAWRGELPGGGNDLPQIWFGHSRGGVTALLTAARVFHPPAYATANPAPADAPKPAGVIAAAAPDVGISLDETQRRILRAQGYLESPSARTGQVLRVGKAWLEEIEASPDAFDPCLAAKRLRCPLLILHGQADATVSVQAAHALAAAAGDRATLRILESANHTFSARNPLPIDEPLPAVLQRMFDETIDFAQRCIESGV